MKHKYLLLPLILLLVFPVNMVQAPEPDFIIHSVEAPGVIGVGQPFTITVVIEIDEADPDEVDLEVSLVSDYQNPIQFFGTEQIRKNETVTVFIQARACWARNETIFRVEVVGVMGDDIDIQSEYFKMDILPEDPIKTITATIANTTITQSVIVQNVTTTTTATTTTTTQKSITVVSTVPYQPDSTSLINDPWFLPLLVMGVGVITVLSVVVTRKK